MNRRIRVGQPPPKALTPELLLEVFDKPIVCNRAFVEMTGQLGAALVLTYAIEATEKLDSEARRLGWFRHSRQEWRKETALSDFEFANAKRFLVDNELLFERNVDGEFEYRLDTERLYRLLQHQAKAHWAKSLSSSSEGSGR
jgi:hypothetical protein